ncbi:MAG TPA: hypothetical protein VE130_13795 [Nitrososphaeraceae archaeon]|nr:hypothetical protein [Nitrososphaeraceae archaeon]
MIVQLSLDQQVKILIMMEIELYRDCNPNAFAMNIASINLKLSSFLGSDISTLILLGPQPAS